MAKLCLNILHGVLGDLMVLFKVALSYSSAGLKLRGRRKGGCPAVWLFLSWVLNEACRIFNLVVDGRQGKHKIVCRQGAGL